jgi:hypothetical protein
MLSTSRAFVLGVAVVATAAGCAAVRQQKAEQVRADQGEFKNLKLLPQNITHDELIAQMRTYARSLGVKCDHCHVALPEGAKDRFDFASDTKPEKATARVMMRMARNANVEYISRLDEHGSTVTCYTCHRGHSVPEGQLPPETPTSTTPSAR